MKQFKTRQGVIQGSILSELLLYEIGSEINVNLRATYIGYRKLGNVCINKLLYPDNLLLYAKNLLLCANSNPEL